MPRRPKISTKEKLLLKAGRTAGREVLPVVLDEVARKQLHLPLPQKELAPVVEGVGALAFPQPEWNQMPEQDKYWFRLGVWKTLQEGRIIK